VQQIGPHNTSDIGARCRLDYPTGRRPDNWARQLRVTELRGVALHVWTWPCPT